MYETYYYNPTLPLGTQDLTQEWEEKNYSPNVKKKRRNPMTHLTPKKKKR